MNRKILFRGKRIDEKGWAYGLLIINKVGYFIVDDYNPHYCNEYGYIEIDLPKQVIPETIGQFTGLCDKNGKEIYEGDRVRCFVGHKKRRKDLYTIIYRLGSPSLDNGTTETPVSFPSVQDQLWSYLDYDTKISSCLQITGNIHEK